MLGTAATETSSVSMYLPPRQWNYGPLSYDRAHVVAITYSYDFPKLRMSGGAGKVAGLIVNDWTLSGVTSFQTGAPLTPSQSLSPSKEITGSTEGPRPTVTCDPRAMPDGAWSITNTFNVSCFKVTTSGFGNEGVGILTGPGLQNWDISLAKKIPVGLGEGRALTIRFESYNTFNHTNYSSVNTSLRFNPNTGAQTNANIAQYTNARTPRIMSLAVRFSF